MLRPVILGLLRDGTPRHGYALAKEYRARSGVSVNTGGFYREIARLVAQGLIARDSRSVKGDPRRIPYAITEEGAEDFDHWLLAPLEGLDEGDEDELAARALFLAEANRAEVSAAVEGWRDDVWIAHKSIERLRRTAVSSSEPNGSFDILPLLLSRRLKRLAADIEFLDELRARFEAWHSSPLPEVAVPADQASAAVGSSRGGRPASDDADAVKARRR